MIHQITLMDAYLIETIRNAGFSGDDILVRVSKEEIEDFRSINESYDFTLLYRLFHSGKLQEILMNGYQVTFLTFPGLLNLLWLKYSKLKDKDFTVNEYVITDLNLKQNEKEDLKTWISTNWQVLEAKKGIEIRPVHI